MLGKLIKHEFRATARIMLPVYAAVLILAVLANISLYFLQDDLAPILSLLLGLVVAAFIFGVIASLVVTIVLLVRRFYTNYLKDEGYLMHTLPVDVHSLIWSKTLVSSVWFLVSMLLVWVSVLITVLIQTGTPLSELFQNLPTRQEILDALAQLGIPEAELWAFGILMVAMIFVGAIASCLQFYAAMSLGHMFSNNKVLLSVVFYIAINMAVSIASTVLMSVFIGLVYNRGGAVDEIVLNGPSLRESITFLERFMGFLLGFTLLEGVAFYVATYLGLKKGLNLA